MTRIGPSVEVGRATYIARVRERIAAERAKVATPGKEMTYAAKLAEAMDARGPLVFDDEYIETNFPYCWAEMKRRNCSLADAVNIIIGNANRVAGQLRRLDSLELDTIAKLKAAKMAGDFRMILEDFRQELDS